jgi:hypothetical protein
METALETQTVERKKAVSQQRPRRGQNEMRPKKVDRDEERMMTSMEKESCKSAALIAGASKILNDFVNGSSWGVETSIEVAQELLSMARSSEESARSFARLANPGPGRTRRPRRADPKPTEAKTKGKGST